MNHHEALIRKFYAAFQGMITARCKALIIPTHRFRIRCSGIFHFDFWRWSRMALGAPGLLLGWSPYLLAKVQKKARARLNRFMGERV